MRLSGSQTAFGRGLSRCDAAGHFELLEEERLQLWHERNYFRDWIPYAVRLRDEEWRLILRLLVDQLSQNVEAGMPLQEAISSAYNHATVETAARAIAVPSNAPPIQPPARQLRPRPARCPRTP